MPLYKVLADGEWDYVEAPTFRAAIDVWKAYQEAEKTGWEDDPESVELVAEASVIRA